MRDGSRQALRNELLVRTTPERGQPALYFQLADVFRRRIDSGEWPVNTQAPTLDQLVADFGTARSTVRQALDILEREGLLARHRGRGTFVLKRSPTKVLQPIHSNWFSLAGPTQGETRELLLEEPARSGIQPSHAGGLLAQHYHHFVRRFWLREVPYVVRFGYLDGRLWKQLTKAQIANAPMVSTLAKLPGVGIDRCEQTITISGADFEISRLLKVPLSSPVAVVDRSVFNREGQLVFENRGYYRGDFVRIDMTLKKIVSKTDN